MATIMSRTPGVVITDGNLIGSLAYAGFDTHQAPWLVGITVDSDPMLARICGVDWLSPVHAAVEIEYPPGTQTALIDVVLTT